jgi:hypothetical protein
MQQMEAENNSTDNLNNVINSKNPSDSQNQEQDENTIRLETELSKKIGLTDNEENV